MWCSRLRIAASSRAAGCAPIARQCSASAQAWWRVEVAQPLVRHSGTVPDHPITLTHRDDLGGMALCVLGRVKEQARGPSTAGVPGQPRAFRPACRAACVRTCDERRSMALESAPHKILRRSGDVSSRSSAAERRALRGVQASCRAHTSAADPGSPRGARDESQSMRRRPVLSTAAAADSEAALRSLRGPAAASERRAEAPG